ncbi:MAG: hypothetical protein PHT07_24035 [Paludibacter sp.]|nr:hypothetical protein [Paludibacter sp.]
MKTLAQLTEERKFTVFVTPSKACPGKFWNITVTFGSGYISEWDWMPEKQHNEEGISKYVAQAKNMNEHQIHQGCYEDLCEECLARIEAALTSPNYAYSRERNYGTTIYHLDLKSPTGVSAACGMPNKIADAMLRKFGHTSSLSPTEDLRSLRNKSI